MDLTLNQQLAVTQPLGNLEFIACAGSRRTEVVARRIVHFLTPGRPDSLLPSNIVSLTFRASLPQVRSVTEGHRRSHRDIHFHNHAD